MSILKIGGCVAALLGAGIAGAALPGFAEKSAAGKPAATTGYVDLAQVTEQIKKGPDWEVMVKKFDTEKVKAQNELESLSRTRLLTAEERRELETLRAKPKPTDAEKQRIDELEAKSGKIDQEYQKLAVIESKLLTDEQRARLQELGQLRERATASLQDEYDRRARRLQELEAQMLDEMQKKILSIVGQVSEAKGLALVVDRQAVLYGGQDLTPDVLKKIGAK